MLVKIDCEILDIINLLKNEGYQAYVVGGYIRDAILGKYNNDVDMTTSAPPEVVEKLFANYNPNVSFSKFGCVKFQRGNYNVEITSYRKEFDYENHRAPKKILLVDTLEEDLIRRDFTINALCSDGGEIIDLFGGINDLKNKSIKTIGDPMIRFEEDSLRILRALRFAAKLGFDIERETDLAIRRNSHFLSFVPFSSKHKELMGLLECDGYIDVIYKYCDILKQAFSLNELELNLFTDNMSLEEKEAMFFYCCNLKVNNRYLLGKNILFQKNKVYLKSILKEYGENLVGDTLRFRSRFFKEEIEVYSLFKEILDNGECYNLKMLNIKGNDLLQFNIKKEKIGKYLDMLLQSVIENRCNNTKKELLNYFENNILD